MTFVNSNLGGEAALPALAPAYNQGTRPVAEEVPIIRQYLRIAMRRRYVILSVIAGCILLSLVVTLLMTPHYTAGATIEISREANQVTSFEGVERNPSTADQEFYQTQYGLLSSRALSERVATRLRLVDDEKFFDRWRSAAEPSGG
jgi:uncharacterized protein involved in exopolysaccharide biosynthesis